MISSLSHLHFSSDPAIPTTFADAETRSWDEVPLLHQSSLPHPLLPFGRSLPHLLLRRRRKVRACTLQIRARREERCDLIINASISMRGYKYVMSLSHFVLSCLSSSFCTPFTGSRKKATTCSAMAKSSAQRNRGISGRRMIYSHMT